MVFAPTSRLLAILLTGFATIWITGCGSTTQRSGTEQLLLSDAVDLAVAQLDFHSLADQRVYLDTSYLQTIKGHGFVNAAYIISSLRQQLTASRCQLQDSRDDADVIVEPRVGALGSNGHEISYGLPRNNLISSAAAVIPGSPVMPAIPEISFARVDAQSGIAKLLVFAYERESREPLMQSGVARAESTSRSSWLLGAGPFQRGTVHKGTRFAGSVLQKTPDFALQQPSPGVNYQKPFDFPKIHNDSQMAESPTESGEGSDKTRVAEVPSDGSPSPDDTRQN